MQTEKIQSIADLERIKKEYEQSTAKFSHQVLICSGAGCVSSDSASVKIAIEEELADMGKQDDVVVRETGCMGTCAVGPVMLILPDRIFYTSLTPEKAKEVIQSHIGKGEVIKEYTFFDKALGEHVPKLDDINFFKEQVKIVLRNCGIMEYDSIDAYISRNGYLAIAKTLQEKTPQQVVDEVKKSGLRGRGGAGFPTGIKWQAGLDTKGNRKFIVCNADEGDPGAFMDRSILEGDPHSIIEGMMLGGYAIGASMGYVYVRAEYPIAVERLQKAIDDARARGLLGGTLFGSDFCFDLEIRIGAGAFVCGEETALMASVEGERGEPRQKPPFPFQAGLFGEPTIINNVETFANIAEILLKGGDWFASFGTEKSKGTKVFALAGDVVNTGIVEVPMGVPLGDILFNIGGGMTNGKRFKAAQIGGPSGGCITKENLNVPVDYESLKEYGAIMGSGGLISMNENACMVDTARFFMDFITDESCGKCTACRIGTTRMLEVLERITRGEGKEGDIELLEEMCHAIQDTAMCGLGQTAPNPVLSTIRYFRDEYEDHIHNKHCSAGVCGDLFLSPCENACPAGVNVPGYMNLIAAGRFVDAYNLIRQENPFPAVCGRVCTHPCESACRRGTLDDPLAICDLKRFAADYAYKNEKPYNRDVVFPKNGRRVAIIGGGVSGLTCGYYLVRIGYDVDVFESEAVAGGVLATGIPDYRLPKDVLQHEIDLIEQAGVNIHLEAEVGKDVDFDKLRSDYDALYIATGTQYPELVHIPGEDLDGVVHGITFLKMRAKKRVAFNKTVAVIGGGNTAIDSARTAVRLGAKKVILLYRRDRDAMPASKMEIQGALDEGIELMELTNPVRFIGEDGKVQKIECQKMELGEFDKNGRRRPVPVEGSNFTIEVDSVIPAVSQYSDLPFIKETEIGLTPWGTFVVDKETMMTTTRGIFAGGDVKNGPDTVIQAIADGKLAAEQIDLFLGGEGKLNKGERIDIPDMYSEDEISELQRFKVEELEPETRKENFDEVVLGYHRLRAMAEAMRCLHCDRR